MSIKPFYFDLTENEITEIQNKLGEILTSGTLILGPYTKQFESEFADYIGCRHAVTVNSGTSALEILLRFNGANGKKIAVPTNTNFASVASIIEVGGTPIYMDMTKEYFTPNLQILKDTVDHYDISGVLWVHIGGIIAPDFYEVIDYCKQKELHTVVLYKVLKLVRWLMEQLSLSSQLK